MAEEGWEKRAKCLTEGHSPREFFEDIWTEKLDADGELTGIEQNDEALACARSICARCPVRRQCYAEVVEEEGNADAGQGGKLQRIIRFGLRAYMTPAQRWSAYHRQAVRCPHCNAPLDPIAVVEGEIACVNGCPIDRTMSPIPDDGDKWTRRHTTLARKVVRWLVEKVPVGSEIPGPNPLAKQWNDRYSDMKRVYDALVADGTLELDGKTYRRRARLAALKLWSPEHLVLLEDVAA